MTKAEFSGLVLRSVIRLKEAAPYDTGNLRHNAVKYEWADETTARIHIDTDIAPYMPYTNEPWVSSFWNGKQNPNLYWFDFAFLDILRMIENAVGGVSTQMDTGAAVDEQALADDFQNKTGDYFPEDVWTHSEYISNQENATDLLISRFNLLKGI